MTVEDLIAWLKAQSPDLPVIAYDDGMFSHPAPEVSGQAEPFLWFTGIGTPTTAGQMVLRLADFDATLRVIVNDDGDWRAAAPAVVDPADYPPHQVARPSILI